MRNSMASFYDYRKLANSCIIFIYGRYDIAELTRTDTATNDDNTCHRVDCEPCLSNYAISMEKMGFLGICWNKFGSTSH